jgi:hypothetical protein
MAIMAQAKIAAWWIAELCRLFLIACLCQLPRLAYYIVSSRAHASNPARISFT